MLLCQSSTLPNSSSTVVSMEYVKYEPEYNPEAITNYYSSGVQIGRSKNPDIKAKIMKAKNHLSALGWTFFYLWKKPNRRELRYCSPKGKTYISLRAACGSLIDHQDHHDLDVSSSIIEEGTKQDTKLVNSDESVISNSRPKKRIRIEDVESSYFRQQSEESVGNSNDSGIVDDDEKKEGILRNRPGKALLEIKKLKESEKKRKEFKPKKRIRKAKPSSVSRRCLLSSLIQRKIVLNGSRVAYLNRLDDHIMASGRIYEKGIQCDCCNMFFLLSKFESHAGSTYRRPSARIFLDDGRSLLDCQTQLNLENEVDKVTKSTESSNHELLSGQDEFCSFCNDGGDLLLCDSCTSSYHSSCIGLNGVPDSEYWFCPPCCCGICLQGHDQDQITCEQCERHFHIDCLKKEGLSMSSDGNKTFCSKKCEGISSGLMGISGISIPLTTNNLSWSLLKMVSDDNNMKEEYTETYSKLNLALEVMNECFEPVQHPWSNNVVEDVIFNRCSKKSNFKGFFTAVLERDEEVISVVIVRVHGSKVAEIPFVATRFKYRRLGMCRILMDELEWKLGELGVEKLVLPAVPDMVSTWTQAFGFKMMTDSERLSLVEFKILDFPGTVKCQKILKRM
ncbi:increased DNA methylation 1 [Lactuca sativa]|uniref:increased DNA methylation 1 n=1 Tax=Lactuca sativa TaxID=4236 RepID=UPI000CC426E3|nr:increased DNA methylation 1 [Lactuca sativa]